MVDSSAKATAQEIPGRSPPSIKDRYHCSQKTVTWTPRASTHTTLCKVHTAKHEVGSKVHHCTENYNRVIYRRRQAMEPMYDPLLLKTKQITRRGLRVHLDRIRGRPGRKQPGPIPAPSPRPIYRSTFPRRTSLGFHLCAIYLALRNKLLPPLQQPQLGHIDPLLTTTMALRPPIQLQVRLLRWRSSTEHHFAPLDLPANPRKRR